MNHQKTIKEIAYIKSKNIFIDKFNIVDLIVNKLVSRRCLLLRMPRNLACGFWATARILGVYC
ncbi:MAG: hypothetical protein ACK5NI_01735, partial [bacterium]